METRDDSGFTLLELMVVVLVIAILLAIAVPSFAGAQARASERAVQSNVRNALTNEIVFYSDSQEFSEVPGQLTALDASLTYVTALADLVSQPGLVFVDVQSTLRANDTVVLGGRAVTGECFWLRTVGDRSYPRFASNNCSSVPVAFGDRWN